MEPKRAAPDASTAPIWTDLCPLDQVATGRGHYVRCAGLDLAVLRLDERQVAVMANRCPHAGGSLAGGWIEDDCVICPLHRWAFQVRNGRCPDATHIGVPTFPARVRNGWVQAQLDRVQDP